MTGRTVFAAALAVSALAAPPALAAPDLSQMALSPSDLPHGTKVLDESSSRLDADTTEFDRLFKPARRSGFARLANSVILTKSAGSAKQLLATTRFVMRDPQLGRGLANLTAVGLGVHVHRIRVGKPRPLRVGDGGFTVNIRVNGKTPIIIGLFRVDRGLGEIDARGTSARGLPARTRGVLRIAAKRIRQGLSPQPLTPPAITGTAQVGAALQASPGTWSDATSFAYAWQRCDAAGTCSAIAGATQPTYTVTAADAGSTLRVVVTAANSVGPTSAESAPTTTVPAP